MVEPYHLPSPNLIPLNQLILFSTQFSLNLLQKTVVSFSQMLWFFSLSPAILWSWMLWNEQGRGLLLPKIKVSQTTHLRTPGFYYMIVFTQSSSNHLKSEDSNIQKISHSKFGRSPLYNSFLVVLGHINTTTIDRNLPAENLILPAYPMAFLA